MRVSAPLRILDEDLVVHVDGLSVVVVRVDGSKIDVSDHSGAEALVDVVAEVADLRERLFEARQILAEFAERAEARGDSGPIADRVRSRFLPLRDRALVWTTAAIARGIGGF